MPSPHPIQPGYLYHIFNRGINGEDLFREERNYEYFLKLYAYHIHPVAETFAFCLMCNRFHLAIRVRGEGQTLKVSETFRVSSSASQALSNLFNAYTKAMNKAFNRTGSLFEHPFHRIHIQTDNYFLNLIRYIHRNPQKHGFVADYRDWKWSSYGAHISQGPTRLQRDEVLAWFDGRERFIDAHRDDRFDSSLHEQDFD